MKDKDGGKEGVTAMPRGGGREERGIQRSGRWEQEGKFASEVPFDFSFFVLKHDRC